MWTICERSSTSLALHTTTTVTATGAATATATATATVTATATTINNAAIGSDEVGTSICSQQEKLADIEHISTIAGSLVSIGTISHIHPSRYGTNDAGYDTEHTSLNSDFDETELRRELLRDKWKLLFDMFDPEGFGEITVDEFINALKSPEFITQVPMNKRELLLERAKKAKSPVGPGYVTFQDFVNVVSECIKCI
uniref:EF-hand domain-containing protein n=1 Tax=Glossina pallidipes TaxID=7398 RepID=A0A1A9ZU38_GLOPL